MTAQGKTPPGRARRSRVQRLAFLVLFASVLAVAGAGLAQDAAEDPEDFPEELGVLLDEERAWDEVTNRRYIKARELSEGILRVSPDSYVANFVLGFVHHYGEANFARALFYENRALRLLVEQHGREPEGQTEQLWRLRMLRELAETRGALEQYDEQLRHIAMFNAEMTRSGFNGDLLVSERAWPLMKLRRFDDAREAANLGARTGEPMQVERALNALCAVEFEAGDDAASYEACRDAMNLHAGDPEGQSAVDFTNFAEAARAVFRLDEAERVGLLATEARVSWYGNPWVELGELYVRQGRYAEALDALRRVPEYRLRRPPHVRDADRNDARRGLTSFFLVIGRADEALALSQKALDAPDRRAHNSRDPRQDLAIAALLHRAGLRLRAERRMEAAAGEPFYEAAWTSLQAAGDRWQGWLAGRSAARNLADEDRLVGTFMIGTHRSAVMPPWLVGELTDVLGAGVVSAAVRAARADDEREGADAYYDAFQAEATLARGDPSRARELVTRSLATLGPSEALLRARMLAVSAEASRRLGDAARATDAYGEAYQADPGVFRRMGWALPVRFQLQGGFAEDVGDILGDSPRFDAAGWGMTVSVTADRARGRACLLDASGSELACAEETATAEGETADGFAARLAAAFHDVAFAPRVDLSQSDANGLDGSNRISRDPLRTMFGHEPLPRDD